MWPQNTAFAATGLVTTGTLAILSGNVAARFLLVCFSIGAPREPHNRRPASAATTNPLGRQSYGENNRRRHHG